MTGTAHTPLPWWIDDDGFIASGSGDDYQTVADPHCRPTVDYGDENGANADFIMRACNSHHDLLAVLKVAVACTAPSTAWVKEARAIIAKAGRAP